MLSQSALPLFSQIPKDIIFSCCCIVSKINTLIMNNVWYINAHIYVHKHLCKNTPFSNELIFQSTKEFPVWTLSILGDCLYNCFSGLNAKCLICNSTIISALRGAFSGAILFNIKLRCWQWCNIYSKVNFKRFDICIYTYIQYLYIVENTLSWIILAIRSFNTLKTMYVLY